MSSVPRDVYHDLEIFRGATGLEVAAIEQELKQLWQRASAELGSEGRPPVTRVGTLNLIALAPESSTAESALGDLLEVSADHPGRILLLETVPAGERLRAEVSAHCHRRAGGAQVCSEVVRLWVPRDARAALAELVAPLLVPDLRTVLWLPGDAVGEEPPAALLRLVDRLVVDSRATAGGATHFRRLGAWAAGAREGAADMAWLRMARWRSLMAQLFEEETARRDLERASELEVEFLEGEAGEPCGRAEAVYFAAWFAARLGYRPQAMPGGTDHDRPSAWTAARPGAATLRVTLVPRPRDREVAGDLVRVCLHAGDAARYEVARTAPHRVAEVLVERPGTCPLPVFVDLRAAPHLEMLRSALEAHASDRLFAEALEWAQSLFRLR